MALILKDRKIVAFETKHPFAFNSGIESLYRFVKFDEEHPEYLESLFMHRKLYHSLPEKFNDPFECKPHWRMPVEAEKLRSIRKELERIARSKGNSRALSQKYSSHSMMDKPGLEQTIRRSAIKNYRKFRICSFSTSNKNILLWSHYADSHKGICVGFDVSKLPIGGCLKVHYQDEYPEIEFPIPVDKRGFAPMLTKSPEWGYEQEYRSIFNPDAEGQHPNDGAALFLIGNEISDIYLGAEISDGNKESLQLLLSKSKFAPRLWQARLSGSSFSITFEKFELNV